MPPQDWGENVFKVPQNWGMQGGIPGFMQEVYSPHTIVIVFPREHLIFAKIPGD